MKGIEILKLGSFLLEMMSKIDLKTKDYLYVGLYDEYVSRRRRREKTEYILAFLSEKYHLSESTVKRIIRRMSKEVNI